jgi:hypothetical protein
MPRTWTVDTADVLRALPYHSPVKGWHSHGLHLVPADGCAACAELRRRRADSLGPEAV